MKYWQLTILVLIGQFCFAQMNLNYHPNRLLIKFNTPPDLNTVDLNKQLFNINNLDRLSSKHGLRKIKPMNPYAGSDIFALEFSGKSELEKIILEYSETRQFQYVEHDFQGEGGGGLVPDDFRYARQWSLNNDGSFPLGPSPTSGADIDMQRAWEITTGSSETIIAVLDSGLKLDHPEFEGRIWSDGAFNNGKDYANNDNDASDDLGHGTNVTSILAATGDNAKGFAGVNWQAQIMPLKILDENNYGYYSWWVEAIYYAVHHGAQVINMSVGGSSYSSALEDAVNYAYRNGVIIVACMMNENNERTYYPAGYDNTIAVGATSADDTRSNQFPWNEQKGSNYGQHIDFTAPGNYIYGLSYHDENNFDSYWSGTSQATPHVAGLISLMLALDPTLNLESVRATLINTSEDQVGRANEDSAGWDKFHGHGRVNAYEALASLVVSSVALESDLAIRLSPNPIERGSMMHIEFPSDAQKRLAIYDVSGRLLIVDRINSSNYFFNTANLETGSYYLKVNQNIKSKTIKFIVK
ncbi:S8 family peptidase [Portibacter marinus]|uniref:S8 family peptidase n=1 Tax=Portibacter marinus TaxID=2898660 RepID=UPI001F3128D7|nr:S8 family peptidase [Portibacter marinus]